MKDGGQTPDGDLHLRHPSQQHVGLWTGAAQDSGLQRYAQLERLFGLLLIDITYTIAYRMLL